MDDPTAFRFEYAMDFIHEKNQFILGEVLYQIEGNHAVEGCIVLLGKGLHNIGMPNTFNTKALCGQHPPQ